MTAIPDPPLLAWTLPSGVTFTGLPALPSSTATAAPPGSGGTSTATIIDVALTFATFASFALGPQGMYIAGAFAGIQRVFDSPQADDADAAMLVSISDLVQQAIDNEAIRDAAAKINEFSITFHDMTLPVFNDYLRRLPIPPDLSHTDDPTLNSTWSTFVEQITSSSPLLDAIATLKQSDNVTSGVNVQVDGFQTFMAGAGLHLYLLSIYVALANGCQTKRLDPAVTARLTNTAATYVSYALQIVDYINAQLAARYNQVSAVLPSAMSLPNFAPSEFDDFPTFINGYSFTDPGAPAVPTEWNPDALDTSANYDPNTVFFSGPQTPANSQAAAEARQNYMNWLAAVMVQEYMISEDMLTVITNWQAVVPPPAKTAASSAPEN